MALTGWDLAFWAMVTLVPPAIIATFPLFRVRISERTLHVMLGFSAGILGGVTFVNILPEAFEAAAEIAVLPIYVSLGVAAGFFALLLVERYLLPTEETHGAHMHIHDKPVLDPRHGLLGVSALTIHGFTDGFVIPISFSAGTQVGIIVTLAIALHQIPDSFAALSLALGTARSKWQALLYVLVTAADTPLGIVLGLVLAGLGSFMIPLGLGFSAGTFTYVSATDLVPELQHESRSPFVVVSMVLGFLLVASMSFLLPQV